MNTYSIWKRRVMQDTRLKQPRAAVPGVVFRLGMPRDAEDPLERLKSSSAHEWGIVNFHVYFPARLSWHCGGNWRRFSRCAIVNNDRSNPSSFGGRFPVSLNVNARDCLLMPFTNCPCAGWSIFYGQLFAELRPSRTIASRKDSSVSFRPISFFFCVLSFW